MATRGFTGRRPAPELADRIPPGQSLTEAFPVLSAGPTPRISISGWSFTLKVGPRPVKSWKWKSSTRCRKPLPRHPLRHQVVEVRHQVGRRPSTTCSPTPGVSRRRLPPGPLLRRLRHQRARQRPDRRQGHGRDPTRARRSRPTMAVRRGCWCRTSTSGNPPSGSTGCSSPSATSPASGSCADITSTAIPGASSASPAIDLRWAHPAALDFWQEARVERDRPQTPAVKSFFLKPPSGARSGRPARRRAPHGAGRLPGAAELLDRLRRPGRRHRAGHRAARQRRSVAVLSRGCQIGDTIEMRGPIGGHFVWGRGRRRPAASGRRRLGRRAAHVDPAPSRSAPRQRCRCCSCIRRARGTTSSSARSSSHAMQRTPDSRSSAEPVQGYRTSASGRRPQDRQTAARSHTGEACSCAATDVRVRLESVRGSRQRSSRGSEFEPEDHPNRAVWRLAAPTMASRTKRLLEGSMERIGGLFRQLTLNDLQTQH